MLNDKDKTSVDIVTEDVFVDPLCKKALRIALEKNNGVLTTSFFQRSFCIGFARAAQMLDYLMEMGYVGKTIDIATSLQINKVLVTLDQLDEIFPDLED